MSTQKAPDLIRLYLKSCRLGFGLAFVFVGLMLVMNVLGLGDAMARSDAGVLVALCLWAVCGAVFSAIQVIVTLLGFADDDDDDHDDGVMGRVYLAEPVPVRVNRRPPPRRSSR